MKRYISEKEDKAYTYMLKILNGIGGTKLKYNWLITNIEAYPENNPKALKLIKENNYLFLSTKELMELLNENDFQWIWAVFSAIPECYNIEEIVKYNLPFADGNYGIHKDEPIIQHPLAEIEIDVEDSSSVTIVTKDNQIADLFKKIYPNAKEDWR